MKISNAFPSKWLKAADLDDQPRQFKIKSVSIEDLAGNGKPEDRKPVVYFHNEDKGFGLNKTNANSIARAYGDDTENWLDKVVELYPTETDFQGDRVECIRVRIPKSGSSPAPSSDDLTSPTRTTIVNVSEGQSPQDGMTVYMINTPVGGFGTRDKAVGELAKQNAGTGEDVELVWTKNAKGGRVVSAINVPEPSGAGHDALEDDSIPFAPDRQDDLL